MWPVTLHRITRAAQKLQVVEVVRAALTLWHHVVDGEVAKGEDHATTPTPAFLFPEELMLVRSIARELPKVRPAQDIGAVVQLVEQLELIFQA